MIGIGDFDSKARNRKKVVTRLGQLMYMGRKYTVERGTGYYVCTTIDNTGKRRRLHDVIWEYEHGRAIPPGCVIHHLDWDKTNNDINNLICVLVSEHEYIHNKLGGDKGKAWGYELLKTRSEDGTPINY